MTHPTGLGEYKTEELIQELASRNHVRHMSEMVYPAESVSSDDASPQKGGSDTDVITKIEQIIDKAIYFATQPDRFNGLSRTQAAHAVMIAAEKARQRQALEKVMGGKE